jgi:hypothetical protein
LNAGSSAWHRPTKAAFVLFELGGIWLASPTLMPNFVATTKPPNPKCGRLSRDPLKAMSGGGRSIPSYMVVLRIVDSGHGVWECLSSTRRPPRRERRNTDRNLLRTFGVPTRFSYSWGLLEWVAIRP